MDELKRRQELRKFLQTRRAALTPEDAGLPRGPRRRTPGLRREEVASLAYVGVTWYTWLEQGRDIQVSIEVLERIARALHLSTSERAYLLSLAAPNKTESLAPANAVGDMVQQTLDGFVIGPAFVVNPWFDVIAYNRLADKIYRFKNYHGPFANNQVWRAWMDPERRSLYADWEGLMSLTLGILRTNYATRIGHPKFEGLLQALRDGSEQFAAMWDERNTASVDNKIVPLRPTGLGQINVYSVKFLLPDQPDHIAFFLVPSDTDSAKKLQRASEALQ